MLQLNWSPTSLSNIISSFINLILCDNGNIKGEQIRMTMAFGFTRR